STKVFCEATAYVTPNANILKDINTVIKETDSDSDLEKVFSNYGLEQSRSAADSYTTTISYTLQPTDDGKHIFASLEDSQILLNGVGEVMKMALSKQEVVNAAAEQKMQQAEAEKAEKEAAKAAAGSHSEKVVRQDATVITQSGSYVILRAQPSRSAAEIGRVYDSDVVTIIGETNRCETIQNHQGCWAKVQSDSGTGYVFDAYLDRI
ncbi:MAG: SH3 domain-containing protein, partial [Neisseria sp.]|nr:SH3 domain-containing protein [Neisseria sp.]